MDYTLSTTVYIVHITWNPYTQFRSLNCINYFKSLHSDDDLEAEASVHEVVIADDELLELDEDFGEFEELEVSLTSCDDDHMPQDKKSSSKETYFAPQFAW